MIKWKREIILSVILILVSIVGFLYCGTMTTNMIKIKAAQPDTYLRLWLGVMMALSIALLIKTLRKRPQEMVEKLWGRLQVFTVVVFFLYLLALPYIGFRVSTLIFMMAVTTVYNLHSLEERPTRFGFFKKLAVYLVFSVVTTFVTEFIFRTLLAVRLPVWRLF